MAYVFYTPFVLPPPWAGLRLPNTDMGKPEDGLIRGTHSCNGNDDGFPPPSSPRAEGVEEACAMQQDNLVVGTDGQ